MRDHFAGTPVEARTVLPVVITFSDDPARLAAHREHLQLDVPVLGDADRVLYHLLGAERASFTKVWNPGTMAMYGGLIVKGRRLRRPRDDTRQLGADAIVDADGRLRRIWLPPRPDARPTIAELDSATRSVA